MNMSIAKTKPISRKLHSEYKYFLMFSSIAILGFLLFYLYPIIRTLMLSFTDNTIFDVADNYIGMENYLYALTNDVLFKQSIYQSLIFAWVSGVTVLVTSLVLAMLLNTNVKYIKVFRTIYFIPFIIPAFAVGAVYKNIFNPLTGLINRILEGLGFTDLPLWYTSPDSALYTMIIISSFGFGVKMLVFLAALKRVPTQYYEIANLEGASAWRKFTKITLPLISPMLFFNIILITIDGLKSFSLAFVMGNGGGEPANSTLLFPIYMFMTAFNMPFRLGYAAAMAWIFFLIILALTGMHFFLSRFYVEKDIS